MLKHGEMNCLFRKKKPLGAWGRRCTLLSIRRGASGLLGGLRKSPVPIPFRGLGGFSLCSPGLGVPLAEAGGTRTSPVLT